MYSKHGEHTSAMAQSGLRRGAGKSRRGTRARGTPNALQILKTTQLSSTPTLITIELTKRFGLVSRFLHSAGSNCDGLARHGIAGVLQRLLTAPEHSKKRSDVSIQIVLTGNATQGPRKMLPAKNLVAMRKLRLSRQVSAKTIGISHFSVRASSWVCPSAHHVV
jgi:hypothetical protein